MKTGLKYVSETVVDASNTAAVMGSGDLPVFATPAMIALMENAAALAVAGSLPEGSTTVGAMVDVVHVRATGLGGRVSATAELHRIDGRQLIFHVVAADDRGVIGQGVHERVVVDRARFLAKL